MSGARVCDECGSRIPPSYVVCDVCGEPVKQSPDDSKDKRPDSHPGYEVVSKKTSSAKEEEEEGSDPHTTVWCTVLGKDGGARAVILFDGAVCLMDGTTIGFINSRLQVASSEGLLLGYVLGDQLYDAATDLEAATLDRGTGTIRNPLGSTLVDIDNIGCARGQTSTILGQFQGLGYKELAQIALYVLFLDPAFHNENEDNECPLPEVEEIVAKAQAIARSDFERETELFPAGTGDKVELQLVSDKDVSTMDFATKMELWRKSMDAKARPAAAAPAAAAAAVTQSPKITVSPPAKTAVAAPAAAPVKTSKVIRKSRQCGECGAGVRDGVSGCAVCGSAIQ